MNDADTMQLLLCALLLISCLLRLIRQTCCRTQAALSAPLFAVIFGYGLLSAALCLVIVLFAGMGMLLPALLLLTGTATAAAAWAGISHLHLRSDIIPALLTGLWLVLLAAVTIFLRHPGETDSHMYFDALSDVSRYGTLEPLADVVMNIVLFLPLGFLLPRADSQRYVWLNVLSTALMLTASIEAIQLLLSLGQADVEDLSANVFGAMAGLMLHHTVSRRTNS